jgi:predicted ATPase
MAFYKWREASCPPQAKLFLSPPLIDMADQRPPQTAKEAKGFRDRLKKVFGRGSQSTPLPPADLAPTVSTITTNPEEAAKLRAKYTHFRILVIGRANAGKTTLLKRVCKTNEDPVYSKVRYPLRLIPPLSPSFTGRLTQPRRC